MGRRQLITLTGALLCLVWTGPAFAQGDHGHARNMRNSVRRPAPFHGARARVQQLSPEERQMFRRNAERWLKMNPQQQNALRERETALREQRRREAEAVLRDSGLRLDNGAREQFEQRYLQERIRIERALRQEAEAKRQQELPQLRERLRNEFQSHQFSPPPSPASGN